MAITERTVRMSIRTHGENDPLNPLVFTMFYIFTSEEMKNPNDLRLEQELKLSPPSIQRDDSILLKRPCPGSSEENAVATEKQVA